MANEDIILEVRGHTVRPGLAGHAYETTHLARRVDQIRSALVGELDIAVGCEGQVVGAAKPLVAVAHQHGSTVSAIGSRRISP
ncbi:MAG: hypothetical protein CMM26_12235 [Rhodospirillaceae bacterium]|nr:hypothetical protein [Rhodospirillaceae bacterium]